MPIRPQECANFHFNIMSADRPKPVPIPGPLLTCPDARTKIVNSGASSSKHLSCASRLSILRPTRQVQRSGRAGTSFRDVEVTLLHFVL